MDGTGRLPISPLNDAYLVLEAPQSRATKTRSSPKPGLWEYVAAVLKEGGRERRRHEQSRPGEARPLRRGLEQAHQRRQA
eukprot:4361514-Prymnesium_polylepis.1